MFFDIFSALCQQSGVSRYKACTDIGLNRAAVAKWKNGAIPSGVTLAKMADYFGVTTDYLLGIDLFAQKDLLLFKINNLKQELASANESDKAEIEASIGVLEESYEDLCIQTGCGIMPTKEQKEKAPTPEGEREIGFDDFTYAFNGEVKELTESDKQLLLSMARQLNEARKQRDGKKTD